MSQNSAVGRSVIARTFKEFENVKSILSLQAIQKEAAGQIYLVGHSLPTPALYHQLIFILICSDIATSFFIPTLTFLDTANTIYFGQNYIFANSAGET